MTKDLGLSGSNQNKFLEVFNRFTQEICVGKKDLKDFIEFIEPELKISLPKNYNMLEDFVNRFRPNASLGLILKKLSKQYGLGLLTNMYPKMLNKINNRKS